MTSLMLAGLGLAGGALGARFLLRSFKEIQKHTSKLPKTPLFTSYYKGGFDPKMSRREAGLILGGLLRVLLISSFLPAGALGWS